MWEDNFRENSSLGPDAHSIHRPQTDSESTEGTLDLLNQNLGVQNWIITVFGKHALMLSFS